MDPRQAEAICARLGAVFTRGKPMDVAELSIWYEYLLERDYDTALRACKLAETRCKTRPSLAEFVSELYAEARHTNVGRALPPPECGVCEGGFVDVRCSHAGYECDCGDRFDLEDRRCPHGRHTASRCPQGCSPPSQEEREARWRQEDADWRRDRDRRAGIDLDKRINAHHVTKQDVLVPHDPAEPRRPADDEF